MEKLSEAPAFTPTTQLAQDMLADVEYLKNLPADFVTAPLKLYNRRTKTDEPYTAVKMALECDETDGSYAHVYKGHETQTVIAERIAPIIRESRLLRDGSSEFYEKKAYSEQWYKRHLGKEIIRFASGGPSLRMQTYEIRSSKTDQPQVAHRLSRERQERDYETLSLPRLIRNYVAVAKTKDEVKELFYVYYTTDLYNDVHDYTYNNDGFKIEHEGVRTAIDMTFGDALLPSPVGYRDNKLVIDHDALQNQTQVGINDELLGFLQNEPRAVALYNRLHGTPFGMLSAVRDVLSSNASNKRQIADKVVEQAVDHIIWQHDKGILDYERLMSPSVLAVHPVLSALLYEFVAGQPDIPEFCRENKIVPLRFAQEYVAIVFSRYSEDDLRFKTNVNAIYLSLTRNGLSKSIAFQDIIQLAARTLEKVVDFSAIEDLSKLSDALHVLFELTRSDDADTSISQATEDRLHTDLIDLMLGVGVSEKQAMGNLTVEDIKSRYPRKSKAELEHILAQLQSGQSHASISHSQPLYLNNPLLKQFRPRLYVAGHGVIS